MTTHRHYGLSRFIFQLERRPKKSKGGFQADFPSRALISRILGYKNVKALFDTISTARIYDYHESQHNQ